MAAAITQMQLAYKKTLPVKKTLTRMLQILSSLLHFCCSTVSRVHQ